MENWIDIKQHIKSVEELEPAVYWAKSYRNPKKLEVIDLRDVYDEKGNLIDAYWLNYIDDHIMEVLKIEEPKPLY